MFVISKLRQINFCDKVLLLFYFLIISQILYLSFISFSFPYSSSFLLFPYSSSFFFLTWLLPFFLSSLSFFCLSRLPPCSLSSPSLFSTKIIHTHTKFRAQSRGKDKYNNSFLSLSFLLCFPPLNLSLFGSLG